MSSKKPIPPGPQAAATLIAFALVGVGTWVIYWPAALIAVGVLLWIELLVGSD